MRRCIDCDAMLVDEVGPEGEAVPTVATPLGEGDQIAYELDGWGNQLRVTLSGMLDLHGIAHVWEVGALVVAAPQEAAVDELIAAVEGGEGEELEADVPQVAFEIEGVSADELAALDAELIAAHIPHAWQETGELLVPEESEDQVADLIDAVLNPSEDEAAQDGLATHAALDALYVAVDKLGKDPADEKLVARYTGAADGVEGLSVPYGMSGKEWEALLAQVAELRQVLEGTADLDALDAANPGNGDGVEDDDEAAERARREAGAEGASSDGASAEDDGSEQGGDVAEEESEADDEGAVVDRIGLAKDLIGRLRTRMLDLV
ncbi:hypothetical protein ACE2AJ_16240 [Aquihabitans daechungensis]|uniref:hypothetical protein n=1 Tax=Aquihabitans daechungensis TaxID=1052257 RepID=UPI003B9EF324